VLILDIDLDLFQSECVDRRPRDKNSRVDGDPTYPCITPWTEARLQHFLESQCGLSQDNPVPTFYVEHHMEVFDIIKHLISIGYISVPVEILHSDAHADLGCGDTSPDYIDREILQLQIHDRDNPKRFDLNNKSTWGGLDDGNFLLFAIACGWVSHLTYIHHPQRFNDIPMSIFPNDVPESGTIQLYCWPIQEMNADPYAYWKRPSMGIPEPPVGFSRVLVDQFNNQQQISLAFVAKSPSYTISAVDNFYPILHKYLRPVSISTI